MSAGESFSNEVVALDPRENSKVVAQSNWPRAQIITAVEGEIRLLNDTSFPIYIPKNEQICNIRAAHVVNSNQGISKPSVQMKPATFSGSSHSDAVTIDPNKQLSVEWVNAFKNINKTFDSVFEPSIGRYNGFSGKLKARILFGSTVPPPRKLHAPTYGRDNLQKLQDKFDELESQGVVGRPEDHDVEVEQVSPSFLVHKSSGGFRLVTAFTALSDHTKTLPTLMPTVENMFQTISEWKYIITADLKDAFYQIPLAKESMKWCGTVTPFRGIRI